MEEFFDFAVRGTKTLYRRKLLVENGSYHVFHRRGDCAPVFLDDDDRDTFVETAKRLLAPGDYCDERGRSLAPVKGQMTLYAYCVMKTHFHLVLRQTDPYGLTDFMRRLQTSYTKRFNRRHGRTGPLFDDIYQARLIDDTRQLKTAIVYVHANPIPALDYRWSGHRLYMDRVRAANANWFAAEAGLRAFGGRANYLEWFMRAAEARKHTNSSR